MYTSRTGLILGFHGTDEKVVQAVLNGDQELLPSENPYDWLGHGIYFWDNSPSRALYWAKKISAIENSGVNSPAVIGAVIDLKYCLDLLDYKHLALVKKGHEMLQTSLKASKTKIPKNKGNTHDLLQRELDCAVIETLHKSLDHFPDIPSYDSVRGVFWEGNTLYEGAGFREKDHIQICIRDIDCIKGYFRPLSRVHM